MRFKTSVRNIQTFSKLTASLSSLGKVAWLRLDDDTVRFTIIPETGTQVWASLSIDSIFEDYTIQSAAPNNTINLELPLPPLHRALKSAINASSASIRLTKKDGMPILSLTIITNTVSSGNSAHGFLNAAAGNQDPFGENGAFREESLDAGREREAVVTQDIPVRVLTADSVEGIHEPRVREPDAHIILPSLIQLKAISDRFTKLAMSTTTAAKAGSGNSSVPKLELAGNMHGSLKLSISTDALNIESVWTGLTNPELDPGQVADGEEGLEDHPSTKLRARGPDAWAKVRIDGRDWGRVLSVGRLGGRVIACFADEHALILYVYLANYEDGADESVLTYYISSFSA
ncbi:Cell cycle checkpoint protein-like protein [Venustampulla echinocandica]|uniref:Checkpoint protein n=1 Tax=Venustampulla echinocandica TaxID=2656787 RepID=A0A370TIW0_9HELO|nr:Cell cycle checkpoint protein-like protein [Venustampulla echinocandica]RDL35297.1 Cell cycle checkpoint protein-like protein [Venustampulla echinocandica]